MSSNQRKVRAAALWQRVGVFLTSLVVTVGFCLDVVWRASLGRLERSRVDGYTRSWSGWLLRLIRMRLSVEGSCPDFNDGRRYIILCNHSSHYDIPASFVAMPGSIRMLAKSELYRIPLLGSAMRAAEFPSINRHQRDRALADLERARKMMESGIVLWAAPEGTRSPDGRLLPFKKGCFHLALDTGAIVVPVAIRGIHRVLPARTRQFNLGQPVSVHIGQPIDSTRYDLEGLMVETRVRMLDLLGEQAADVSASAMSDDLLIRPQAS